jgi:uncharacterized protein (TIGR03790 family)
MRLPASLLGVLLALAAASAARGSGLADRVIVVANASAPDSLAVARHYAEARGVPAANVIVLPMPVAETISWREFVATIWQPLEDQLVKQGWIDGTAMELFDHVGRRKYAIYGHRIAALVLCRGVPLRIANDPSLFEEVPGLTSHAEFRTNEGAVDSELSLLAQNDYPINASIPNPLYHNPDPTREELSRVVKVSRLDGPTAADASGLVDLALQAERSGLLGRAYVDIAGPHEGGNRWLDAVASQVSSLGFDSTVGHGPQTFAETGRFDAPVLYFGWYTADLNGPFSLPGFRFPPGAIALHIHSFSAHTLRSASEGWCGPLLARGVTATFGNVFEPYLEFLHRPDLLVEALARGENLVDAAYYSLPVLSWQSVVIGDPLYRPFAVPVTAQVHDLAALPAPLAGYAVIREMNLLDAEGSQAEAIEAGRDAMKQVPSLALALAVGSRVAQSGNAEGAAWTVNDAAAAEAMEPDTWELLREAAGFLAAHGKTGEAIGLYRKLFAIDALPVALRTPWLDEARRVALASGDVADAADWREQISRMAEKPLDPKP